MSLRSRIENSTWLAKVTATLIWYYLSLCQRTTKWQAEGVDDLRNALSNGPILLVMWHGRLVMSALHWPIADATLSSLHDTSPIGRVVGVLHTRAGLHPMRMSKKTSNLAASRTILKRLKDGISIGMTADGPLGPALVVNDATLEWARVAQVPIFSYAYSTTRGRRLDTWDDMLVPHPFGRGSFVFARFNQTVPRKMDAQAQEKLRRDLDQFLTQTGHRADQLLGLEPRP